MKKFRLIGLTGGIASGKSTVARIFTEQGMPALDADKIARDLSQPGGAAHAEILKRFGTADRAALRQLVFQDAQARADLEAILHPLIAQESAKQAQSLADQLKDANPVVIYEAALLVETERYKSLDGLIVVESPLAARIQRLVARDRISEDMALRMISAQTSDEDRRRAATHVLINDADENILRTRVIELAKKLQ